MSRAFKLRALFGCGVVSAFMFFGVPGALAAFHGVAQTKGCTSPTKIGSAYTCQAQILNVVDTGHDTVAVTGLSDSVHSAGGDVNTGNILSSTGLVFSGPVSCVGGSGAGTSADPYIGATSCLMPFGTTITTKPFSHYTVQPGDFNLPNHQLTDTVTWNWNNTCVSDPDNDCTTGPQVATAGSSAVVQKLGSSATTDIHNGAGQTVTTVEVGTAVHDFVTVTGQPGQPNPTGNVNIDWFLNGTCAGAPAVNSGSIGPLNAAGQFDATGFAFTPPAGFFAFKAHYEGDATYTGSDGPCEPLRVVDANIQITPQTAQNPINTNHTLTGHVNVNDGNGFTNAPDGTQISFSIQSGPGSFVGPSSCTTAGGTGSCTAVITSGVAGTTTVRATTTVAVGGLSLTRTTGDGKAGDSADATKDWFGGGGLIAPTQTTCQDVLTNTAQTLTQVNYSVSGGKIGQGINPGVFFFYSKITTTVPNQVVTISQSNTSTNNAALFQILNGQAWLWTGDCSSKTYGTVSANGSGASFTIPTPGNYIISLKYQTKSIAGTTAPVPADITYNFTTSLGGNTGASLLLKKQ